MKKIKRIFNFVLESLAIILFSLLIGSISSFLILNSGKDCKGWRSQFRSVAKE